jgi:hypothetical protein
LRARRAETELPLEGIEVKYLIEIIGWIAAAMMLSAYLLLTSGRLSSSSRRYQWLNAVSGAGFILNSGYNGAYPSASINVLWVAIGLYGLARGVRRLPTPAS